MSIESDVSLGRREARQRGRRTTHVDDLVAVLRGRLAVCDSDDEDGLAQRAGLGGVHERPENFVLEGLVVRYVSIVGHTTGTLRSESPQRR